MMFDFFEGIPAPGAKRPEAPRTEARATPPVPSPAPPPAATPRQAPARRRVRLLDPAEAWLCFDSIPSDPAYPEARDGMTNLVVMSDRALWRLLDDCNREFRPKGFEYSVPLMGPEDRLPEDGWRRICGGWEILDWDAVSAAMEAVEGMDWVRRQWLAGRAS